MLSNDETPQTPSVPGFAVRRLLGVGGGSAVWLLRTLGGASEHGELHGEVALKLPHAGAGASADIRAELRAMEPLRHEHIVRTYGAVETSRGLGLLLEPYTAGPLSAVVRAEGGLTPGGLVTAATPVAQALAHLHGQGAAHGDVSPGNVLLSPEGRPALADLGDSQLLGMPSSARGTEGFLAPEREDLLHRRSQAGAPDRLEAQLAPEADVYSLAAVCWFVLTAQAPAGERDRPPLSTLCPEAPSELVALLEEGLSALPEDRPTAAEFAHGLYRCAAAEPLDLSGHVDDEVLPELPTRLPERRARTWRRPGAVLRRIWGGPIRGGVAAAALGLLLAAAAGWFWWAGGEPPAERPGQEAAGEPAGTVGQEELARGLELLAGERPEEAVEGLAMLRTAALQAPGPEAPELYAAPGSPALQAERRLMEELAEAELSYTGETLVMEHLGEPDLTSPGQVALEVRVTAQDFRTEDVHVQQVLLILHRTDGRWLLWEVQELPGDGAETWDRDEG